MSRRIQSIHQRDFTGGLNLRADAFQLGTNETPDVLNMDMDPRGGFHLRAGTALWGELPAFPDSHSIHSMTGFYGDDGSELLVAGGGDLVRVASSGGDWSPFTNVSRQSDDEPWTAVQFAGALYLQSSSDADGVLKFDGTDGTRLGLAFSDDFNAPTSGNMQRGRRMAVHNGHLFVGNCYDGAQRFPSRVRFSHPNRPEAWRTQDWFDVDPGLDGDEIVQIVSYQDQLVILKRRSSYLLYGFDATSWQLQNISRDGGCVAPAAVASSPYGIFWWDAKAGPIKYDGKAVTPIGDRIVPAMDSQQIPRERMDEVVLAWVDNRLWCRVPWGHGTDFRVLVFDPTVGRDGAWTMYDHPSVTFLSFGRQAGSRVDLGARDGWVLRLAVEGQPWDESQRTIIPPHTDTVPLTFEGFDGGVFTSSGDGDEVTTYHPEVDWGPPFEWDEWMLRVGVYTWEFPEYVQFTSMDPDFEPPPGDVLQPSEATVGFCQLWEEVKTTRGVRLFFRKADPEVDHTQLVLETVGGDATNEHVLLEGNRLSLVAALDDMLNESTLELRVRVRVVDDGGVSRYEIEGGLYADDVLVGGPAAVMSELPYAFPFTPMVEARNHWGFWPWSVDRTLVEPRSVVEREHMESRYVTAWVDAGDPAVRKRWRRPWGVMRGTSNESITIEVYRDFNSARRSKFWQERINPTGADGFAWDSGVRWNTPEAVWATQGQEHNLKRGSTLGLAHAVQLKFIGPQTPAAWGFNAITYPFIPRRLR